jgi:hypothetical protein
VLSPTSYIVVVYIESFQNVDSGHGADAQASYAKDLARAVSGFLPVGALPNLRSATRSPSGRAVPPGAAARCLNSLVNRHAGNLWWLG